MTETNEVLLYEHRPDGIHEMILLTAGQEAVDAWADTLAKIHLAAPSDKLLMTMTEFRGGILPIKYSVHRMRAFMKEYPNRPPVRAVCLYPKSFLVSAVTPLANSMLARDREVVQFFTIDKRDEAIRWLLQKPETGPLVKNPESRSTSDH